MPPVQEQDLSRPTVMACESEGETISPSGVPEKRRSLDIPVIRASWMKRLIFPLMLGLGILGSGYFGMYAYYRFINPAAVIDRVHIRDPGFAYGTTIADSFCGESIVSKLAGWTGKSIAPTVNQLYAPLAALDQAINGRSIHFADAPGKPVFTRAGATNSTHTIDPADLK